MDTKKRITILRNWMKNEGYSAIIIPSTDPHCGEYVPEYWEIRRWISGFTGSAGTAVITLDTAALWTDSRYFIQAAQQLEGSGISLMKDRLPETPSIGEWLPLHVEDGSKITVCGEMFSHQEFEDLQRELDGKLEIVPCTDPFDELWQDRPSLPKDLIYLQPAEYTGKNSMLKIAEIRSLMEEEQADYLLISALDEIAWTTNLRGNDVHCNPVFISYLLIGKSSCVLYVMPEKISPEIQSYLESQGIQTKEYKSIFNDLKSLESIWIDSSSTNQAIYNSLQTKPHIKKSPVSLLKSVKNEQEIEGFHQAMLRDGVAMVKFLKWLRPAVLKGNETELSISDKLENFRSQQEKYLDISFDTISAYGEHGAIVHYEPTPETDIPVKPEGFLLLDSGAQYADGTTDITRTIALGPLSDDMKLDYTLVLKGFIQLGLAKFPTGTCGTQLDALARQFMWKHGKNYLHGTGHGVGSHLCVHEGPHQIRMNHVPAILKAGMTVTDEPGIYLEGRYGIRTENTLLIVPFMDTEFGSYLQFEHLTLCPIDTEPILLEMLSAEEKDWLNSYHKTVYEKISPFLDPEEKEWLAGATKSI